jgi:cytochrome d ubiquinol oxidase subunit II
MILDYETMRLIWWALLGALLIGFAITGGFDLGTGILLPFIGKTDNERRVILNSVGATWEGNQVWLVTAGGALFAAWPMAYAVAFSSFYLALMLTLVGLWLRPVGFDFRSKLPSQEWRFNWDKALFLGGFIPALIFGVAFGNLLKGVPFHLDNDMRIFYDGSFFGLLNPFSVLAGLLSVAMLTMHGAVYLQLKTEGIMAVRSQTAVRIFTILTLVIFAGAGFWVANIDGYHVTSEVMSNAPSMPLNKMVQKEAGLWLDNFGHYPVLWAIPALAFVSGFTTLMLSKANRPGLAFITSSLTLTSVILTAGVAMFPFLLPSSIAKNCSLTIWDASSSLSTLKIMLLVTLIFLPIVLAYTSWVFKIMRGKVTVEHIQRNDHTAY